MTVAELITQLQSFNPNTEVLVVDDGMYRSPEPEMEKDVDQWLYDRAGITPPEKILTL